MWRFLGNEYFWRGIFFATKTPRLKDFKFREIAKNNVPYLVWRNFSKVKKLSGS
jgi:hypothetical protein